MRVDVITVLERRRPRRFSPFGPRDWEVYTLFLIFDASAFGNTTRPLSAISET